MRNAARERMCASDGVFLASNAGLINFLANDSFLQRSQSIKCIAAFRNCLTYNLLQSTCLSLFSFLMLYYVSLSLQFALYTQCAKVANKQSNPDVRVVSGIPQGSDLDSLLLCWLLLLNKETIIYNKKYTLTVRELCVNPTRTTYTYLYNISFWNIPWLTMRRYLESNYLI